LERLSLDAPVQRLTQRLQHSNGSIGWINWTIRAIFDESGNLTEYQAVGRDMTELHNLMLELERSKEYYHLLSNEAPISIIAFDEQGRVTFVNQWHLTFFGGEKVEEDFYLGRHVTELPGIVKAGIVSEIERILQGQVVVLHEVFFPEVLAGYSMYANIRGVPIIRNEALTGGILIREDVTRYKAMEQELKKANQAKSDFLANISHELRTPMNAILGLSQVALEREASADQVERLQMIHTSGKTLLSLIDELLDLSRIEAGSFKVEHTSFNLPYLLHSVIMELRPTAAEKGLFLKLHWESSPPSEQVRGDPLRLRQVLRNLIGNGLKYSSSGGVTLMLESMEEPPGSNAPQDTFMLRFRVRDTGPGVAADKQEEIFQPFSRIEPDAESRTSGTGLGLSISRQIVHQLGGEIWVESDGHQGSDFVFTLPFAPAGDSTGQGSAIRQNEPRPLHILLADDEPMSQTFTKEFLESKGHAVSLAEDGSRALERLRRQRFDVVLMDIRMPVMDGLTAARRIRSSELEGVDASVPIIALSANAEGEQVRSYRQAGMNDCIAKPVELDELLEAIYRHVSRKA
jgi:PAS domain S-box-containing protein